MARTKEYDQVMAVSDERRNKENEKKMKNKLMNLKDGNVLGRGKNKRKRTQRLCCSRRERGMYNIHHIFFSLIRIERILFDSLLSSPRHSSERIKQCIFSYCYSYISGSDDT